MQDRRPRSRRLRAAVLPLLFLACACAGSERENDPLGMTSEERLGLYLENAAYYLELGDYDRMIFQAEKGLQLDPDNERFLFIYARGYLLRGSASDIQRSLDTLQNLDVQDDWRVQSTWAMALERKGVLYDEAADAVRTGQRATDAPDPIARARELRDDAVEYWRESKERFTRSVELRSGEIEPLNGLVRVSGLLGEYDDCVTWSGALLSSIESAQRLIEDELRVSEANAEVEERSFRDLRAFRQLEIKTRLALAEVHFRRDDYISAADELDLVTVLDPDLAQAYSQRAQVLFKLGEYRRAKDSIQRYLELRSLRAGAENDPAVRRAFELSEACDRELSRKS